MIDRRGFMTGLAAAGLGPVVSACGGGAPPGRDTTLWVSAQGSTGADPGLVAVSPTRRTITKIPTGFRGHDVAQDPARPERFVLFGRRPSTQSVVVDLTSRRVVQRFSAGAGRGFQGHGCFTPGGRWLVTSEADLVTGEGRLAFRDPDTLTIARELDTFGVGPHEVKLMPDGATLVVANGGLLTRPDSGRQVLNLETMDSTLVYLDLEGALVERRRVPESKASIRHLDVTSDGTVAFGLQVQRAAMDHDRPVPLAGAHRRGAGPVVLFDDGREVTAAMDDYVGSVAVSSTTGVAAFSSPRGDVCGFWRLRDGALVGYGRLADGCGLAATLDEQGFVLTSSTGEVRAFEAVDAVERAAARHRYDGVQWDNHLLVAATGEYA